MAAYSALDGWRKEAGRRGMAETGEWKDGSFLTPTSIVYQPSAISQKPGVQVILSTGDSVHSSDATRIQFEARN